MAFTEILVGRRFFFRGARRLLLWPTDRGVARVIAESEEGGVVHVEVLRLSAEERAEVDIGHLPMSKRAFKASFLEYGTTEREIEIPDSLEEWRRRHVKGEVGAFSVPIWKAAQMAWATAEETAGVQDPLSCSLRYAFPTSRRGHSFMGVEIELQAL